MRPASVRDVQKRQLQGGGLGGVAARQAASGREGWSTEVSSGRPDRSRRGEAQHAIAGCCVVFIAHAPAGYLVGRGFAKDGSVVVGAVVGAVFPDVDMLRFWWDHGQVHHHRYWTHIPAVWLAITVVTLLVTRSETRRVAAAFCAGVFSHLALDTVCGDIAWLWPLDDRFFHLITVRATAHHWIVTFVLHPAFLLEIAIALVAAAVWWRSRNKKTRQEASAPAT